MKKKRMFAVGILVVLALAHAFVGVEGLCAGWLAVLTTVPYSETRFFSAGAFALSAVGVAFGKRWVAVSALPIALANVLWRFCSGRAPSEFDGEWVLVALSCLAGFIALYVIPLILSVSVTTTKKEGRRLTLANGNIGIGNIFTLATFSRMFARAGGECCQC